MGLPSRAAKRRPFEQCKVGVEGAVESCRMENLHFLRAGFYNPGACAWAAELASLHRLLLIDVDLRPVDCLGTLAKVVFCTTQLVEVGEK